MPAKPSGFAETEKADPAAEPTSVFWGRFSLRRVGFFIYDRACVQHPDARNLTAQTPANHT
jgi:hypothetical protein